MEEQTIKIQKKKSRLAKWWVLILDVLILGGVGWYLIDYCSFGPNWLVILILACYWLLLLINFLSQKIKRGLSWIFTLLLIAMAVLIYIFCGNWTWWMWVLVIVLYLTCLIYFFRGNFTDEEHLTNIPLLLYLLLMLLCLNSCSCLS
jgi:hypothetical protein